MAIARAALGNMKHPDAPAPQRVALRGRYAVIRDRDPRRDGSYGMKVVVNTPALNDLPNTTYVNELPEWHTRKLKGAAERREAVIAALEQQVHQNELAEKLRVQELDRKLQETAERKPKPNADTPRKMELRDLVHQASTPLQLAEMLLPDVMADYSSAKTMDEARLMALDLIDAL